MNAPQCEDRARGALTGLVLGDALGVPLRGLSRSLIHELYGQPIGGFVEPSDDHEIEAGRLIAGEIGPGALEALGVIDHVASRGGKVEPDQLAADLDLAQRSDGAPQINARAAVRCAPLGMITGPDDIGELVGLVANACRPSHDSHVAIAAASSVAAAVSAALAGRGLDGAVANAVLAARLAAGYGHYTAAPSLAQRLDWALACVDPASPEPSIALVCDLIGTSRASQEAIPAAFALLATLGEQTEPWLAARWAASLGGAAECIAAIVACISGACHGLAAINADAVLAIEAANPGLNLDGRCTALLAVRA